MLPAVEGEVSMDMMAAMVQVAMSQERKQPQSSGETEQRWVVAVASTVKGG